ncbi:MAG TPA: AraC family transcriptional regulator [Alphaproteobacteria bacterium]|nr:AraC family transcriptional regulator [Alphaproteobacteria bacterium]
MSATDLRGYTVFDHLRSEGVPLRASARFGDAVAAALWDRDETTRTSYNRPAHHTLSLYVEGGEGIRRRRGPAIIGSRSTGSLCLMPAGLTTDWDVSGPVRMFHLYVPKPAFDRVVVEALDTDPAAVSLRDETYFQDTYLETAIRSAVLPMNWDEPAERMAVSHAGQMLLAYLASRYAERGPRALVARGGLAPAALRRVVDFVEANLDQPLAVGDLARIAGLSAFHFARMFKQSTGESPHGFVLRRRIEQARARIRAGNQSLADIALACGFSGQSHFTARFRQVTGMTPRQFQLAVKASRPGTALRG